MRNRQLFEYDTLMVKTYGLKITVQFKTMMLWYEKNVYVHPYREYETTVNSKQDLIFILRSLLK